MNSLFYARYDPASSARNVDSNSQFELTESIKKRKTNAGAVTIITKNKRGTSHQSENAVLKSESGRDKFEKKKKSKRKENEENENIKSKPEPKNTIEEITAVIKSDDERNQIDVHQEQGAEKALKLKKNKRKGREDLPVKAHEPSDGSTKQRDAPQKENIKHKKIRDKREKSALLAKVKPKSAEDERTEEDENPGGDETASSIEAHGLVPIPQPQQGPHGDAKTKISALPDWLAHPTVARFSDTLSLDILGIHPTILSSLKHKGYKDAFAVQATVVPMLLPGPNQYDGDICISAATGSGKTLAYALPLIENLRDRLTTKLRGLIVVPTRELVTQARNYLEVCASGSKLQIGTAVGSKSIHEEKIQLVSRGQRYDPEAYQAELEIEDDEIGDLMDWDFDSPHYGSNRASKLTNYVDEYVSKVDILICTPGRLVDHMRSTKGFTLDHVQWLVIDEADRLLDESFQEWVDIIMPALAYQAPLNPMDKQLEYTFRLFNQRTIRKIVLSATMTKDIGKITALQLRRPKMILLENAQGSSTTGDALEAEKVDEKPEQDIQLPSTLVEIAMPIANAEEKPLYLIHLLENSNWVAEGINIHSRSSKHRPKSSSIFSKEPAEDTDSNSDISSTSSISSSDSSHSEASDPKPNPAPTDGILIFSSNNENALRLARLLTLLRPQWAPIIHTLTKSSTHSSTRKILSSFNTHTHQGNGSILIASDRASRGLDLPRLAHVINYDIPPSVTSYVHRVGRTARAGKAGVATTLVAHHEARWFWNDIARNQGIGRGEGRKVRRVEPKREITEEERREYADALEVLGREARGEGRGSVART